MTNSEQIALYWKQVEAIEEERSVVDAKLEESADAIRAKIRALEPPLPGSVGDYYARIAESRLDKLVVASLYDRLMSVSIDADNVKIGEPMHIRYPLSTPGKEPTP